MHIGILTTYRSRPVAPAAPSYAGMIRAALGSAYVYSEFDVVAGDLPGRESNIDGYVITGSPAGVHDGDPWIARLSAWLRVLDPMRPVVGICFGHQIMAQAYGGIVERANKGLIVGLRAYDSSSHETWMDDVKRVVLPAYHRDWVTRAPDASRVIATSQDCPVAGLAYGERRAASFQAHPEFTRGFLALAINRAQEKGVLNAIEADRARESLEQTDDCALVIGWIRRFLEGATR